MDMQMTIRRQALATAALAVAASPFASPPSAARDDAKNADLIIQSINRLDQVLFYGGKGLTLYCTTRRVACPQRLPPL